MDLNTVPNKPNYSGTIAADGATFPQPVYEQWTQDYANETGIQISYTGGGSARVSRTSPRTSSSSLARTHR